MNRRRLAIAASMIPIGLIALACEPVPQPCGTGVHRVSGQTEMQEWHFQNQADPLEGFAASQGTAQNVPSLTAGETGLELSQSAVIQQSLNLTLPTQGPTYIGMIARCDQGARLEVEAVASVVTQRTSNTGFGEDAGTDAGAPGTGSIATPVIHILRGTIQPTADWAAQTIVLTSNPMRDMANSTGVLVSVQISVVGSGSCSIDEVELGALDSVNTCQ